MADDLKLGIDISADLSKLATSLQQAEMKVAQSGQKMQRAVSLVPGIGIGNMASSAGGAINMAAPHPNNVSFSSLNATGGNGATQPPGFRPGIGNLAGGGFAPFGPAQTLSGFGILNAIAGGPVGPRRAPRNSLFIPNEFNNLSPAVDPNAEQDTTTKTGFGGLWLRGLAGAAITAAAGHFADNTFDLFRDVGFMNRSTSGQNQSHFAAQIERDFAAIPLVGGLGVSLAQKISGKNYTATDEITKAMIPMERENAMGLFGGGLQGRQTALSFDQRQRDLQLDVMRRNRVAGDTIDAFKTSTDETFKRKGGELSIDFQQRHLNLATEAQKMGLQAMGLGKYGDILSVNRKIDEQLSRSQDDSKEYRTDLERLRKASISALMMGGMSAGETISLSGQGGALGEGSVRLGSASGQSDEIKALLEDIARNTAKDTTAVVGRN